MTPKNSTRETHPPQNQKKLWFWLLILNLALSGCHMPRADSSPDEIPAINQRLTQAAALVTPTPYATVPHPTSTKAAPILPSPTANRPAANTPVSPIKTENGTFRYTIQQGDTLPALALRFDVSADLIKIGFDHSPTGFLPPGQDILIPQALDNVLPYPDPIFPDSEITYGPSVKSFNVEAYVNSAGGFLASYEEPVNSQKLSGADIVQLVAIETSTNPTFLLAFLEYRSGWVFGHPEGAEYDPFPIGYGATPDTGLYKELMITAKILAQGYYGWRDGSLVELNFYQGGSGRLSPGLNAGSVSLMTLFAAVYPQNVWESRLFQKPGFLDFYEQMFGDYWARAHTVEPYLTPETRQPRLYLPFLADAPWSLTGGAHITWQTGTPRGALDFAPITGEEHCAASFRWSTAAAPGLVVRSDRGAVALDLDGDGDEGTGWVLVYMHISANRRAQVGEWLDKDDRVGHPSCEGGRASGTHVHLARKYNGEWVPAEGPLPLIISGWQAFTGEARFEGWLQQGDEIITASPNGEHGSTIYRKD
jgi:LasA protease